MERSKKYYKNIDLIRLVACIAILLYHLNILKGGYLAVCTFFVLSGYLATTSSFKKEKFSLLTYYKDRLLKLYLPLVLVVFLTITALSFFQNITWFNLKPETTSVLLGYNNYWQLGASMDYFARHIDSPFIHLWYISILLQFDLIFPFIFIIFRKIGEKVSKFLPCFFMIAFSVIATVYFYKMSLTQNVMVVYYGTFTRIFSIFFGVALGFIHSHYKQLAFSNKFLNRIIFLLYLIALLSLFILVEPSSKYFLNSMIITTIISCRLISYGTINPESNLTLFDKIVKFLSGVSYEVYLFQYPIIYLFQYININKDIYFFVVIGLILILSFILHFSLNGKELKLIKYLILSIIIIISAYGIYQYYLAEDHTAEMKKLEEQLKQNTKMIDENKEKYEQQMKQEQDEWIKALENLENDENNLKSIVSGLPVVGIGDSVMLGAVDNLYGAFPNGYFDAKISRTAWKAADILQDLINKNMLGNPIIINLGANGDCSYDCKIEIMNKCDGHNVFWINTTNYDYVNQKLFSLAESYPNLHIIDWKTISSGHPEYFVADGIHLTEIGKQVYTNVIYDSVFQIYSTEYQIKKEELMTKHEEKLKSKISFYGNDILLNAYEYFQKEFNEANFNINKDYNYNSLKSDIEESITNGTLNYKVVFVFDDTNTLNLDQYRELIELCKEHKIYILISTNNAYSIFNSIADNPLGDNVVFINFYEELIKESKYLLADKIHLSDEGNDALVQKLKVEINQ